MTHQKQEYLLHYVSSGGRQAAPRKKTGCTVQGRGAKAALAPGKGRSGVKGSSRVRRNAEKEDKWEDEAGVE